MTLSSPLVIEGVLGPDGFHQTNGGSFALWLAEHDREVAAKAWKRGHEDGQWSATHQDVNPARNPFHHREIEDC